MPTPTSQDDWTIHSINIHGVFFERWCQYLIKTTPECEFVSSNYPVEYPPPSGPIRGQQSNLDIRGQKQRDDIRITLLIECKKNNPELTNWVFFPKSQPVNEWYGNILLNEPITEEDTNWQCRGAIDKITFPILLPFADEGRETRANYLEYSTDRNKAKATTKTSNAAIQDAAYQIALATQCITSEERMYSDSLGGRNMLQYMTWKKQILLPMIVTSAHLYTCDFDTADVNSGTGEIDFTKATLTRHPSILYEYPLPRLLQQRPADLAETIVNNALGVFPSMCIIVVHSANLVDLLHLI